MKLTMLGKSAEIALTVCTGGNVNAPIHLDGVVKKRTVLFDDKLIMKNGKLL